jgi:hypothetical protein
MPDLARRAEVAHACHERLPCQGVGVDREMGGEGGGGWRVVSQSVLDEAQGDTGLAPMRRRAVAQGVHRGTLGVPTGREGHPEGILPAGAGHGGGGCGHADAAPAWSGEEPQGMAGRFPGLTQECSGALRQRDRAVFGAFAVPHGHEHAGPVHVRHWEVGALWQAQTTGGERRQTGPRAQQRQGREKGVHRFDTEENRELLLAGCTHKGQGGPRALEGVLVAERDTAQGKSAGTTRRVCDVLEREERVAEFFCGDAGG